MQRHEVAKVLGEANNLWVSGKKRDAVNKYQSLLNKYHSSLDDSDRPLVLKRVIKFDADNGNATEARTLILEARQASVSLSLEAPKALAIVAEINAAEEAKRIQAAEEAKRIEAGQEGKRDEDVSTARKVQRLRLLASWVFRNGVLTRFRWE